MTKTEMLSLINANPIAFLATIDGDAPRVRAVMILKADDEGVLFNTGKMKDLCRQLLANPKVEMCFYAREGNIQLRLSGTVRLKEDESTYRLVLEKLPFLQRLVETQGTSVLAPFILEHGRATRWSMATNFEPKRFLEF